MSIKSMEERYTSSTGLLNVGIKCNITVHFAFKIFYEWVCMKEFRNELFEFDNRSNDL